MKAIVSTNYDPKYIFFMPIVGWCWWKLGVEVRYCMPFGHIGVRDRYLNDTEKVEKHLFEHVLYTLTQNIRIQGKVLEFTPPSKNHEVTYTQVSRLFAAADTLILDDEILITSDIDMAVFKTPPYNRSGNYFDIFGSDLVPPKQTPMCYVSATAGLWRKTFVKGRTLQECLDDELAAENCENMRGNLWCRDQELMHKGIMAASAVTHGRAKFPTQFASNRVDRDNSYWLEDLMANKENIMDAHLWRPGYTEENTEKIIRLLEIMYPEDTFDWVREYAAEFRNILNQ